MPHHFLHTTNFFSEITDFKNKYYLLTVSGGVDSMVLLHLFAKSKVKFCVAHCNFQLRGQDSELDQKFVEETCRKLGVPIFVKSFETKSFKEQKNISTQMAARELRYQWFHELRVQKGFDYIVTGHHLNDSVETVLLNLARGTGLEGMTGMKVISDYLFRPLLKESKEGIKQFAEDNTLRYREDASNSSNDYKRNKLRNKIIPLLQEINPGFLETMTQNMDNFSRQNEMYTKVVEKEVSSSMVSTKGSDFYVSIKQLKNTEFPDQVLYHFLKPKGFNFSTVNQLINCLLNDKNATGKFFYSPEYRALIDREKIIISLKLKNEIGVREINNFEECVTYPIHLSLKRVLKENLTLSSSKHTAYFDAEKIKFPLRLRVWKKGDTFRPFGMVGKKKISDLLIDNKVSIVEKEKVFVLESDQKIIWVVGYRSSEHFKINSTTKEVLIIKLD